MTVALEQDHHPRLWIILGDQLDLHLPLFTEGDSARDYAWMAEVAEENERVWTHKSKIVFFLSAMRHFRALLGQKGWQVQYHELGEDSTRDIGRTHAEVLDHFLQVHAVRELCLVLPGDWRILQQFREVAGRHGLPLTIFPDPHFYCTVEQFREYAGDKNLILEYFYRWMRRRHKILVDAKGQPEGGNWNYDAENRAAFGKAGPAGLPVRPSYPRDQITQEVMDLVETRFAHHPGEMENFNWPVTHESARQHLEFFISSGLSHFGKYEDAMWAGEPFLHHSTLSPLLNIKLLGAREVVDQALLAYRNGSAPLNSVEGFIRQILGWREYIRGIYWMEMPLYAEGNALQAGMDLPDFFWTGETDMACVRDSLQMLLHHGYLHHIHRLMVLGLLAQMTGVHPYKFHEWHMAMYLDAVDWVSLPNTLGMSQFGDGGLVGTKPYCATGKYIDRMSNYCRGCRFQPEKSTGPDACPFTTLYWDFLARHEQLFSGNRRMAFQIRNLQRKDKEELSFIRQQAGKLRENWSSIHATGKRR